MRDAFQESPSPAHPLRCFFAEFVGAFILVLIDAGSGVASSLADKGEIPLAAGALAPGLAILALIFSFGEVSGAHLNPAVTLSFALRGVFPWKKVIPYWFVQFSGAILAAAILYFIFDQTGNVGATEPLHGTTPALFIETLTSTILILVILSTAHQHKIKGPDAAFPVSAAIIMCGLLGKAISGGSMNPARSFGPDLIRHHFDATWIYFAGPIAGALIAAPLVFFIHGRPKTKDEESAQGSHVISASPR